MDGARQFLGNRAEFSTPFRPTDADRSLRSQPTQCLRDRLLHVLLSSHWTWLKHRVRSHGPGPERTLGNTQQVETHLGVEETVQNGHHQTLEDKQNTVSFWED